VTATTPQPGVRVPAADVALLVVVAVVLILVLVFGTHPGSQRAGAAPVATVTTPANSENDTTDGGGPAAASAPVGDDESATQTSTQGAASTGTPTTPSDETDSATSASPPPPSSRRGPATVLRRHLAALESGNYDEAFSLMSSSYRDREPRWPALRQEAKPAIAVESIGTASITDASADVPVTFYARDRFVTQGSDTQCRQFSGTAHMIRTGSSWRYDPPRNHLTAAVLPSSSSRCP
jgi:hypothetical protein